MNRNARPSRLAFRLLEALFSFALLATILHHVLAGDFRPLAALCAPILVAYYGMSSLLFVRGKSLAEGPWQVRSMHAAERAMQATVWHLLGIVLGVSVHVLLREVESAIAPGELPKAATVLAFLAPYALLQMGLLAFLRAIWTLSPHLTRRMSAFEVRRRVGTMRARPVVATAPDASCGLACRELAAAA